jgi:quercetin dioxygenase-like cupin family protein
MENYPLLAHSELVSDRTPRPLMAPVLQLDLNQEATQLRAEWPWEKHGHNARTLLKNPDACLVQISLKAGATIPQQRVGLRLTIQVLAGKLQVEADGSKVTLGASQLLSLEPNLPHAIEGQENSELLLWLHGPQGAPNSAHTQHTG